MFPDMARYYAIKNGNFPTVEVTPERFVELLVETGKSKKDAEIQLKVAIGLGSNIVIGNTKYSVKELK